MKVRAQLLDITGKLVGLVDAQEHLDTGVILVPSPVPGLLPADVKAPMGVDEMTRLARLYSRWAANSGSVNWGDLIHPVPTLLAMAAPRRAFMYRSIGRPTDGYRFVEANVVSLSNLDGPAAMLAEEGEHD